MAYTPRTFRLGTRTEVATSQAEETNLFWDGWTPDDGNPPTPDPVFSVAQDAALRAAYGRSIITVGKTRVGVDFCTLDYPSDDRAVQAAINAITTGFSGGGEIRIAAGVYDFVTGVTVDTTRHNVTIAGAGTGTILRWKNGNTFSSASAATNWLITTSDYMIVRDLQMQGNSTFGCPINGVNTFNAGAGSNILGGGVRVAGARVWLHRLYITGMAEDGVTNVGGIGTKYSELEIIGCGGVGVNITTTAVGASFATDSDSSSVWVGSCGTGMNIAEGGTWIAGAHIWGCQNDGIFIDADCVRVTGCYIETNAGWGINVNGRSRNVISGCDIWANGLGGGNKGGIQLGGSSTSNIIMGNQLRDSRFHSVLINSTASSNVLQGNVVSDSLSRSTSDPLTAITYTASGAQSTGSTFTDANTPSWITSPLRAVGVTLVITGAGAAGATLTAQVTGWSNPSAGVYTVTLSSPIATAVTNPVYSVHAVAYGVRETGNGGANVIMGNIIRRNDVQLGAVVLASVTGANSSSFGNVGVDAQAWVELGTLASGTMSVDLRNGNYIHATLSASLTAVSFFAASGGPARNTVVTVSLTQDGSGGKTVAGWPANVKFSTAGAPTFPSTGNATGTISFRYDGTNWIEQSRAM